MMRVFEQVFLGWFWSTLSLLQISPLYAEVGVSSICTNLSHTLEGFQCDTYMSWNKTHPNDTECIAEIIKSKMKYDAKRHEAYANLTYEYCSNVTDSQNCSTCFHNAFHDIYNQSFCSYDDSVYMNKVQNCLKKYNSSKFIWSRKVIFERYNKTVNLSENPYRTCAFNETKIPENKTVIFPVYIRLATELTDSILNVLLSLFLEAFEIKNGDNSTGVTCQHILDSKLLLRYKVASDVKIKNAPLEVKNSYSNLRRSMCQAIQNESYCMDCYNKTDEKFLFHLYNKDRKVSSLRVDFLQINDSLRNCSETYISKNYSKLSNYTYNLKGSWNTSFGDCLSNKSKEYLEHIVNNSKTIDYIGRNEAVVRSVALNYFAFHIYQDLQANKTNISCEDVNMSHVICAAWRTIQSITIFSPLQGNITEDKQLMYLGGDIGNCGMTTRR